MNNQTEIIKPSAVSSNAGTATNVASPAISKSVPAVTGKPKSVKLELSEEEADMIQTLLNDYVLAYRSDRSVDYKPEPVPREKVGQYPYVATPPAPEITNPAYDWINKKWYSKNTSDSLPDLANTVTDLKAKNEQLYQVLNTMQETQNASATQSLGVVKMMKQMSEDQSDIKKLMGSMQGILLGLRGSKVTQPEASKADTQSTQPSDK